MTNKPPCFQIFIIVYGYAAACLKTVKVEDRPEPSGIFLNVYLHYFLLTQ